MLKNKYQEILVGMGLMSLVRGIISSKRNRSTLLIDDPRFAVDSYAGHFLSELEVKSFIRLGNRYEIPELVDIRNFLTKASIDFVTENQRLKLGNSPLTNIQEVLRKFSELLDGSDLDLVFAENEEEFSKYFFEEMTRYENLCHDAGLRSKGHRFELQGPKWLKTIYQRLGLFLNQEYQESKNLKYASLLHLLGLSSEEKLKTSIGAEEIPYYFFRLFSPIYRLQDFFLSIQLKRRLTLLGGDYKQSTVQFWQFHENKFENLLLASFEGVISGDRVLFFSHLPTEVPFGINSPFAFFRKTQMIPAKRITAPFPPTHMTFCTDTKFMGSERPFRVHAEGSEFAFYHWPYPELPGSKSGFYDKDLNQSFEQDAELMPFTHEGIQSLASGSVTLDLRSLKADIKHETPALKLLPLEISAQNQTISGFEYWGPFRYRSLGLLALTYGVEGI